MNSHMLSQKRVIISFLFFLIFGAVSNSFASTLPKKINTFWIIITNPVCAFIEPEFAQIIIKEYKGQPLYVTISDLNGPSFLESLNDSPHKNFLIKILTFYNKKSLENLNIAAKLGEEYFPYAIFLYNQRSNWFFLAKQLDAPSVLLYGYSWIINISQKILQQTDTIFKYRHKVVGVNYIQIIDDITNIASLFIEFPLSIFGTISGSIIGIICHPIDSITSILGMIYFIISTTLTAIFGVISNFLFLAIHLFGYKCTYFW